MRVRIPLKLHSRTVGSRRGRALIHAAVFALLLVFSLCAPLVSANSAVPVGVEIIDVFPDGNTDPDPDADTNPDPDAGDDDDDDDSGGLLGIFDRLGDITDGFSRIENLLDPDTVMDYIGTWVWSWVTKTAVSIQEFVFRLFTNSFFSNDYIVESLKFFQFLGGLILAAGTVFAIFSMIEKEMHGDVTNRLSFFTDIIKAWGLFLFVRPVVFYTHEFTFWIAKALSNVTITGGFSDMETGILRTIDDNTFSIYETIAVIIMLVVGVIIIFQTFKRFCVLYIQILTGYLYVFDVARGNPNAIGEWGRELLTGSITYGLQYMLYQVGMVLIADGIVRGNDATSFTGMALLVGAGAAGFALKRWGQANQKSGAGGKLMQAGMMAAKLFI